MINNDFQILQQLLSRQVARQSKKIKKDKLDWPPIKWEVEEHDKNKVITIADDRISFIFDEKTGEFLGISNWQD